MGIRGQKRLQKILELLATLSKRSFLMVMLFSFSGLHLILDKLATVLHQYVTPRLDSFNKYLRGKLNAGRTQLTEATTAKQG